MAELEEFGERLAQERRLKAVRDRRDILQKDVAAAIGTTATNVSRWEAGLNMPGDDMIKRLAAYFAVSAGWLRYGEETKSGAPRMEQHQLVSPGSLIGGATGKITRETRRKRP